MTDEDRAVIECVGRQGKTLEAIVEQFPQFDIQELVRADLVELKRIWIKEAHDRRSAAVQWWIVLTPRGAEEVGIDPDTLLGA